MFLGRKKELEKLEKALASKGKSAILIYGRRRIGKTSLIAEALKNRSELIIRFTAVPDELSANAERLSIAAGETFGIPGLRIPDFEALLKFIASRNERIILVIDEYQDLRKRAKGEVVDAYFRDFIDNAGNNITLIISGSAIRVMKSLLEKDNPLYKRFSLEIPLGELGYLESSLFYPEKSIREKIELYSVFGGIPMILSHIDPGLSVQENISRLLLDRDGFARTYAEDILYHELKNTGGTYSAIIRIGNGKRSFSEIKASLDDESSRNSLEYTLEQLQKADFIERKNPINHIGNRKKTFYELKSNMLRFHLKYIEKNPGAVSSSPAFFEKYIYPSFDTFVSYRFEEIAREWFIMQAENGIRTDILNAGTYWYDNPAQKTNGEFDVALETLDGYEIYEAKYLSAPMKDDLIAEETRKIRQIAGLNIVSIGFISSSGFETPGRNRISAEEMYCMDQY